MLSDTQIVLDLHPEEAAWQASVAENTIGIVKGTMTRVALERPHLIPTAVWAAAVLAHTEMERDSRFLSDPEGTGTCIELGSITLRQRQRNSRSELSVTSAWDGNSQRRVAESTQRRQTEESIPSEKQAFGTFQTRRRSGLLETRQRQRCATTHQRQVSRTNCGVGDEHGNR